MSTLLTIDSLPAGQRARRWREAVSETFVPLDCRLDGGVGVHGTLRVDAFDSLRVARVTSGPQRVDRTRPLVRAASDAWVLASVQLRGRTVVEQAGAQAVLRPGDVAFYDTARAYRLVLPDDFDQVVLYLPRDAVEAAVPHGLGCVAVRLPADEPCARSLQALVPWLLPVTSDSVESRGDGAGDAVGAARARRERAAAHAQDLFLLALERLQVCDTAPIEPLATRGAAALFRRATTLVEHRLDDPDFGPVGLARELGVSWRRLQEVFENHRTTPSATLREARLECARALLADAETRHDSIASIGSRAGFDDPAGFSRRFRARYGRTPREYRREVGR